MKKINTLLALLVLSLSASAQVGINPANTAPHASAMLDISHTNKGLLMPRVALQSLGDNTTIPGPATSLLVWNTNANMPQGTGFYYNSGTPQIPKWQAMKELILPYYQATSEAGPALRIDNYEQFAASSGIRGYGGGSGRGVEGHSNTGVGVYAYSDNGTALEVNGKLKIHDNGQMPRQGQVLTTDGQGNATWQGAIAFSARGLYQNQYGISPFNTTKVKFAAEAYDLGGSYSGPTAFNHSVFTAPYKGIYHFDVQLGWPYDPNYDGDWSYLYLKSKHNGVTDTLGFSGRSFDDEGMIHQNISLDMMLEAGTEVWVEVMQSASVQMNLNHRRYASFFNGRMVVRL